jgi:hypothetical protein
MAAGDVGARFRELAMRHPSLAWPSSTAVGWRIGSAGSDDVAAVTDPFASAYAGIDPVIATALLRWAWLRTSGSGPHSAAVSAAAAAISERRIRRGEIRM